MPKNHAFPTPAHQQAAAAIVDTFSALPQVHAVLLVNSCARGVAIPESDLDMAILVDPALPKAAQQLMESQWLEYYAAAPVFTQLKQLGRFSGVHLDLFNGLWQPERWDEGGGPDAFEIEIGNQVAHAVPLWQRDRTFADLRAVWLPYYAPALQQERLRMVQDACRLNVDRLQFYVGRTLYFQAFDRLYHAFQEFLQALFISRSTYPIAYNKWIREQVEDWLQLPTLYKELPSILQVQRLESRQLLDNARQLLGLLDTWTSAPAETALNDSERLN